jgi:hypothetical protein
MTAEEKSLYGKKYREDNKERLLEYRKKRKKIAKENHRIWHQKNKRHNNDVRNIRIARDPIKRCIWSARYRAKKYGIPFDITYADLIMPEVCPYLQIPLVRVKNRIGGTSPTLDRIVPELGYVKGNVQIISDKANRMKNNASPEELILFAQNVLKMAQHNG